ncbi:MULTISPECIES: N-glycosylase/DNA lyase [Acidiplasma]|uniref:8-oxoguanine DNA glycosylase/AP lyase n=2 Tax=Acidiplasma TaxID=507753 RepID=A0A0Q0RK98_9ARCH|nr:MULTISPECIES: N-glycosylase/DNA lyase [Acidiplasma]KJE48956.1 N-glycosylase [Acidiplasma sp. MBA-1]KQB35877.1 N-glycosylase [Acidiplasma cupricumulans]WMT54376.1 MAG: N-glycosylase/DNA lyase [Acidiplasma sp.]
MYSNLFVDKVNEIRDNYFNSIEERVADFKNMGKSRNRSLFIELSFCILTANTSAEMGIRTQRYINEGFIDYDLETLRSELRKIKYRFYNKRSEYIVNARFIIPDLKKLLRNRDRYYVREYLVENIKGVGYKEASHFLRNVGIFDFAILDKHIMKLLHNFGFFNDIKIKSGKDYKKYEEIFNSIAYDFGMEPGIFDLYLWKMATGKILK